MSRRKPLFLAVSLVLGTLAFLSPASAQQDTSINTEIRIPVSGAVEGYADGKVADVANYIGVIYQFLISIVGLVAAAMIIIGGFQYLTSAGDSGKIGAAKTRIFNALVGLVITFSSWLLLNTINPALLEFKPLSGQLASVKTELEMLPWCEDVIKGGAAVKRFDYGAEKQSATCGSVGEFEEKGNKLYCMFRGSPNECGPSKNDITTNYLGITSSKTVVAPQICFPNFAYTQKEIAERIAKVEAGQLGTDGKPLYPPLLGNCSSCADLERFFTPTPAHPKGRYPNPQLCTLFQNQVNEGPFDNTAGARQKSVAGPYTQYCGYDPAFRTCASGIIQCGVPQGGSCENYDQFPLYYRTVTEVGDKLQTTTGWWVYGIDKQGVMASHPGHLESVCTANPCGYNLGKGGCTGSSGVVNGIRTIGTAVRDGISGIQNCENK